MATLSKIQKDYQYVPRSLPRSKDEEEWEKQSLERQRVERVHAQNPVAPPPKQPQKPVYSNPVSKIQKDYSYGFGSPVSIYDQKDRWVQPKIRGEDAPETALDRADAYMQDLTGKYNMQPQVPQMQVPETPVSKPKPILENADNYMQDLAGKYNIQPQNVPTYQTLAAQTYKTPQKILAPVLGNLSPAGPVPYAYKPPTTQQTKRIMSIDEQAALVGPQPYGNPQPLYQQPQTLINGSVSGTVPATQKPDTSGSGAGKYLPWTPKGYTFEELRDAGYEPTGTYKFYDDNARYWDSKNAKSDGEAMFSGFYMWNGKYYPINQLKAQYALYKGIDRLSEADFNNPYKTESYYYGYTQDMEDFIKRYGAKNIRYYNPSWRSEGINYQINGRPNAQVDWNAGGGSGVSGNIGNDPRGRGWYYNPAVNWTT